MSQAPGSNKKLGPDLWLAARNGELDKVQALVERGAPVNFKYVSRQPKLRPYPLHVAVFRNRLSVVSFLLSQGADPLLRNYRKETALDIARQNDLHDALAMLERGPSKLVPQRASTAANKNRDIKNIRKQEQPDAALGPVTKEEIVMNLAGNSDYVTMMAERQEAAIKKKEQEIRERKELERKQKEEEERVYLASLASAGEDELKRAKALEKREALRKQREQEWREWEEKKKREEEEGRKALEAIERKRMLAQQGIFETDEEERKAREEFERKEREAVQKALERRKQMKNNTIAAEEEEVPKKTAPKKKPVDEDAWASLAAEVGLDDNEDHNNNVADDDDDDDDFVPPPSLPNAPPSWSEEDEGGDDHDEDEDIAAQFLAKKEDSQKLEREKERMRKEKEQREREERREREEKERREKEKREREEKERRDQERKEQERLKQEQVSSKKKEGVLEVGGLMKAKYSYKALRDDELSFKKHSMIEIVAVDPKGKWHTGRFEGKTGKCPANYF